MKPIAFVLAAAAALAVAACGTPSTPASGEKPQLMFVQSAEDLKVDPAAGTFRLVRVNPQTLYFSDRPIRMAGNLKMADYLKTWKDGRDSFGADPPNAALAVYEPGRSEQTFAVVTISKPVVDGADLVYAYKVIEGTMPASGGPTSLFIDWYGVGGGVGPGFHGVGYGARGPGLGGWGGPASGFGVRPGFGYGGPGVAGPRGIGW